MKITFKFGFFIWLVTLCVFFLPCYLGVFGKDIRNGYTIVISEVNESLENLNCLLSAETVKGDNTKIKKLAKYISDLTEMKNRYLRYYGKTTELINLMQEIDPELFLEINSIKDREGNLTDVYVKVVPLKGNYVIRGRTIVDYNRNDNDVCLSEYGSQSLSVEIADHPKVLFLLAHEFGHVRYIVPNLAEYEKYYHSSYDQANLQSPSVGHKHSDLSGISADITVRQFKQQYQLYKDQLRIRNADKIAFNKTHKKG